jgi:hypothetical protein
VAADVEAVLTTHHGRRRRSRTGGRRCATSNTASPSPMATSLIGEADAERRAGADRWSSRRPAACAARPRGGPAWLGSEPHWVIAEHRGGCGQSRQPATPSADHGLAAGAALRPCGGRRGGRNSGRRQGGVTGTRIGASASRVEIAESAASSHLRRQWCAQAHEPAGGGLAPGPRC